MKRILIVAFLHVCCGSFSQVIPNPLGVNIHFTDPLPGELEELAATGWNYVRVDFTWSDIETQPGIYDFNQYDSLLSQLQQFKIKPIFILDYTNPLYDDNLSPYDDTGRNAFANWAAASTTHFQGNGIIWELYNEPNLAQFWKPYPNVTNYALLAIAVGQAVKDATPNELLMGPATNKIDFDFLESAFQKGILEYFDAVSVHPYRDDIPESVILDWERLTAMIQKYKPVGKTVPIVCSEWGYSTLYPGMNEENQGKVLPRMMLVNLASYINVSIWYDWHNDCNQTNNVECNFGTVTNPYHPESLPVYTQKPNYKSAQVLMTYLAGLSFETALNASIVDEKSLTQVSEYFLYKFSEEVDGGYFVIAAWTTSTDGQTVSIDLKEEGILVQCFQLMDHLGENQETICADSSILIVTLQDSVVYLLPQ